MARAYSEPVLTLTLTLFSLTRRAAVRDLGSHAFAFYYYGSGRTARGRGTAVSLAAYGCRMLIQCTDASRAASLDTGLVWRCPATHGLRSCAYRPGEVPGPLSEASQYRHGRPS